MLPDYEVFLPLHLHEPIGIFPVVNALADLNFTLIAFQRGPNVPNVPTKILVAWFNLLLNPLLFWLWNLLPQFIGEIRKGRDHYVLPCFIVRFNQCITANHLNRSIPDRAYYLIIA